MSSEGGKDGNWNTLPRRDFCNRLALARTWVRGNCRCQSSLVHFCSSILDGWRFDGHLARRNSRLDGTNQIQGSSRRLSCELGSIRCFSASDFSSGALSGQQIFPGGFHRDVALRRLLVGSDLSGHADRSFFVRLADTSGLSGR